MKIRAWHTVLVLATAAHTGCSENSVGTPGAPTTMSVSTGNGQSGPAGTQLASPIAVKVTDAEDRGVPGQRVDFFVTTGGGQVRESSVITNEFGVAATWWTVGSDITKAQTVAAKLLDPATGGLIGNVTFQATALAGPPKSVFPIRGTGQTGNAGQALPDSLYAFVSDSLGNPVRDATVTFAVTSGGGSVSPVTVKTGADGRAATLWTVGPYGQPQQVTATVAGVPSTTFVATAVRVREGTSVTLGSRPFGLGISSADVIYVGQLDNRAVVRFEGTTNVTSIQVGNGPVDVAFSAAGTRAWVSNQLSQSIFGIDVATNTVDDTIAVTGNPFRVLLSPDESRLYVLTDANKVYAFNVTTGAEINHLDLSNTPNGVAVTSDGTKLYVSTHSGGTVVEINTSNMTASRTFTPGGTVQEVLLSPDGAELYTVNEQSNFFVYNLTSGTQVATVSLGTNAGGFGAAMTPDHSKIFVTLNFSGEIKVIDRITRVVARTIYVAGAPRRIKFRSDGTAVIPNESGYVTWVK